MAGFNIAKLYMPFLPFSHEPNSSCFARYGVTVGRVLRMAVFENIHQQHLLSTPNAVVAICKQKLIFDT